MRLTIFGKDLVLISVGFEAIGFQSILSHPDTAKWHECPLKRLIGLDTDNLFEVLIQITWAMRSNGRWNIVICIQHAAIGTFLLFQIQNLII